MHFLMSLRPMVQPACVKLRIDQWSFRLNLTKLLHGKRNIVNGSEINCGINTGNHSLLNISGVMSVCREQDDVFTEMLSDQITQKYLVCQALCSGRNRG